MSETDETPVDPNERISMIHSDLPGVQINVLPIQVKRRELNGWERGTADPADAPQATPEPAPADTRAKPTAPTTKTPAAAPAASGDGTAVADAGTSPAATN